MVHLRVADKLLDKFPGITETEFVVGNMAPDSGIPNENWSIFTPSSEVSHFRTTDENGIKLIHEDWYIEKYFTSKHQMSYNAKQYSFYLGYLVHLLTDKLWARDIVYPLRLKSLKEYEQNRGEWFRAMKQDWRTLDLLYLKTHTDFRSFVIYEQAIGFQNTFMDFFAEDAFDNRRAYITSSYRKESKTVESKITSLSEEDIKQFINNTSTEIYQHPEVIKSCQSHT